MMTEKEIRADFKKALDTVKKSKYGDYWDVSPISKALDFGFSDEDIKNLAILHRNEPKYRSKISDLLQDCNFHTENADFEAGRYEKYISDKTEEREETSDETEDLLKEAMDCNTQTNAETLADLLTGDDWNVPLQYHVYGIFEDLAEAYLKGSEDVKKGIDMAVSSLTGSNMKELAEEMIENDRNKDLE